MKPYFYLYILIISIFAASCEGLFDPAPDGRLIDEDILANPAFAEGLLLTAYKGLPNGYNFGIDVASDDAVSNQQESTFTRMATGEWKSSFNPLESWGNAYRQIYHINLFLKMYGDVSFGTDPRVSQEDNDRKDRLHKQRLKGEAHGLRAWYQFDLLQSHAGKTADGRFLGFPILTEPITIEDNWKLPRNTLSECIQQIMADLDTAIANLPNVYADIAGDGIHNITMGAQFENRITGNAARALKSRVALLAASPAYAEASNITWADAATIAGNLLSNLGGLYPNGVRFFTEIKNKEIIWNNAKQNIRSWEQQNFPPSLFGNGRTNPSQSLVDAFPMQNGYPIGNPSGNYNPEEPYSNRDPRLGHYIIHNGASFKGQIINTFVGADQNGINNLVTSTRTGYYLKKFMMEGVKLDQPGAVSVERTYVLIRMTELLLNYAEAANEAWGAEGDPLGLGFTAKSKIQELRNRAGITQPDNYLLSLDTEGLRALIRNERRIELCFEGFRFWDIRRWNSQADLNKSLSGVFIDNSSIPVVYNYQLVEERTYQPFMIYGPVPFNETLKYNLDQNAGWD